MKKLLLPWRLTVPTPSIGLVTTKGKKKRKEPM
jgi:hypothetical protein